ncbi:glycosyltransferase [Bradyrhizobium sp. 162]|uniref:glycosyltransferase family 2 protein n=1 Tax=Bradyrhizobium sp. 162 TaxID=2782635 RepID=UPI001FFB0BFB|nr:glycosyltransferase [Bradyrhizobium sp. 162]MCK1321661.1 glycosyltransferase [Bradyrhizobium sp. 156]MCK1635247.1 glycosyltransferase [Bradyrhizobium sp. 162]
MLKTKAGKLAELLRGRSRSSFGRNVNAVRKRILQLLKSDTKILLRSQLFDATWYLRRYPDVAAARLDPLTHYVRRGAREGRNPNPLFDGDWYLDSYPDVAAAGINPLVHYAQYGDLEGRDPHPSFSTRYYLEQNPDVATSGLNALAHFLLAGTGAGRRAFHPNAHYSKHVLKESQQLAIELPDIIQHIETMLFRPMFRVFIDGGDDAARAGTLASVKRQVYGGWSIGDLDWSRERTALEADDAGYIICLRVGDVLNERALYEFANAVNADPMADIVYGDEDFLENGVTRSRPFYKPDWSPDTLESLNYLESTACVSAAIAAVAWSDARGSYDFMLRATEAASRVVHVRSIVCHRRRSADDPASMEDNAADIRALTGRLMRTGRTGSVTPAIEGYACYDVTVKSSTPLVSVIIPTAGQVAEINGRRVDLITNCIDSIERVSSYKNLEFVIVDNGDLGGDRCAALRARGCKFITFTEKKFNVSKKLNLGASIASGEMLLLLNDDIEPHAADWIERLLEHFEKPHVGVVGAKLLYPDMTLQHVGVATNQGNPEHLRRMHPADDRGYFFSSCTARDFSAVTGACMMARADVYRRVGGYNEALAISYNDVDFCFKIREAGLTAVFAPRAQLIHFESQSRSPVLDLAESEYFHARWAHMLTSDPYYNEESLEVLPGSFEVKHNPRWL